MRKNNELPASLRSIDIKRILRSRGIYDMKQKRDDLVAALRPMAKTVVNGRKKEVGEVKEVRHESFQFTHDEIITYWEKQIHIVEVLEAKFDNKVKQFITKIVDGYMANLESEVMKDYISDNEDDLLAQAQLDFTPLLTDTAVLAGQEALQMINSKDVYTTAEIRKLIADNVAKFATSMLSTDQDTLAKIVADGVDAGQSVAQIRNSITDTFDTITKNQAQRITRTEVLRASNQAAVDAWQQSGVVGELQWVTAGATDECADYEGQTVPIDNPGDFYASENDFQDGAPPLHPNCRCVLVPILEGEKAYIPQINKAQSAKIKELESQIDKRTKEFKELKAASLDDKAYISALEKYLSE